MRFFKENSYDIVRLFVNQVGITIFSWVLYTAIFSMDIEPLMRIVVSVFSTLFFFVLIYTASWDYGAKDKLRIDSGRLDYNKFKGLLLGLFANSVNITFAVIDVILMAIYIMTGTEVLKTIYAVFDTLIRFGEGMYLGVIRSIVPGTTDFNYLIQSICFVIAPLLAVTVTYFGYLFGIKNIRIFGALTNKKVKK